MSFMISQFEVAANRLVTFIHVKLNASYSLYVSSVPGITTLVFSEHRDIIGSEEGKINCHSFCPCERYLTLKIGLSTNHRTTIFGQETVSRGVRHPSAEPLMCMCWATRWWKHPVTLPRSSIISCVKFKAYKHDKSTVCRRIFCVWTIVFACDLHPW